MKRGRGLVTLTAAVGLAAVIWYALRSTAAAAGGASERLAAEREARTWAELVAQSEEHLGRPLDARGREFLRFANEQQRAGRLPN